MGTTSVVAMIHFLQITALLISVLSISIKIFIIEISYSDDPTVCFSIKSSPSFQSYQTGERGVLYHLSCDENSLLLERPYDFIADYGWVALPLLTGLLFMIVKTVRGTSRHRIKRGPPEP